MSDTSELTTKPVPTTGPTCLNRLHSEIIFVWTVLTTNTYLLGKQGGSGKVTDPDLLKHLFQPLSMDPDALSDAIDTLLGNQKIKDALNLVRAAFQDAATTMSGSTVTLSEAKPMDSPGGWNPDGSHPSFAELRGSLSL